MYPTQETVSEAFDYEQVTVSSTSIALTASKYNPTVTDCPGFASRADRAIVSVEDNAGTAPNNEITYRLDGTAPTASTGRVLSPNDVLIIDGYNNIANAHFIRVGTTDVKIDVQYFRSGQAF